METYYRRLVGRFWIASVRASIQVPSLGLSRVLEFMLLVFVFGRYTASCLVCLHMLPVA